MKTYKKDDVLPKSLLWKEMKNLSRVMLSESVHMLTPRTRGKHEKLKE